MVKRCIFIVGIIVCVWYKPVWAEGFQTLLDTEISFHQPSVSDKFSVYPDYTGELILRLQKKTESKDEFFVYKNQQCIFQKELMHSDVYQIYKLRNLKDRRIFYVLNSAQENWLMGYDANEKCWQLYITGMELPALAGKKMLFEKNGALLWTVYNEETKAILQQYQIFWDEGANWFGYQEYIPTEKQQSVGSEEN
jgi:hypothetical protein